MRASTLRTILALFGLYGTACVVDIGTGLPALWLEGAQLIDYPRLRNALIGMHGVVGVLWLFMLYYLLRRPDTILRSLNRGVKVDVAAIETQQQLARWIPVLGLFLLLPALVGFLGAVLSVAGQLILALAATDKPMGVHSLAAFLAKSAVLAVALVYLRKGKAISEIVLRLGLQNSSDVSTQKGRP